MLCFVAIRFLCNAASFNFEQSNQAFACRNLLLKVTNRRKEDVGCIKSCCISGLDQKVSVGKCLIAVLLVPAAPALRIHMLIDNFCCLWVFFVHMLVCMYSSLYQSIVVDAAGQPQMSLS